MRSVAIGPIVTVVGPVATERALIVDNETHFAVLFQGEWCGAEVVRL